MSSPKPPKYAMIAIRQASSSFEAFANAIAGALNTASSHGYELVWADRKDRGFLAIVTRPYDMGDLGGEGESAAEVAETEGEGGAVRGLRSDGVPDEQMSLPLHPAGDLPAIADDGPKDDRSVDAPNPSALVVVGA